MTFEPTEDPTDDPRPFKIQVADRVKRLPAYLFARINDLTYQKRRAGDDVIDMSMGNPTDPPSEMVIEKLVRGGPRSEKSWLQPVAGDQEFAPRGGCEISEEIWRAARSRKRVDRHARLEGRLQPHVPGAVGPGRHGHRAGSGLSGAFVRRGAGVGQRDFVGSGRQRKISVEHRLHLPASASEAEAGGSQLSAQSVDGDGRAGILSSTR